MAVSVPQSARRIEPATSWKGSGGGVAFPPSPRAPWVFFGKALAVFQDLMFRRQRTHGLCMHTVCACLGACRRCGLSTSLSMPQNQGPHVGPHTHSSALRSARATRALRCQRCCQRLHPAGAARTPQAPLAPHGRHCDIPLHECMGGPGRWLCSCAACWLRDAARLAACVLAAPWHRRALMHASVGTTMSSAARVCARTRLSN